MATLVLVHTVQLLIEVFSNLCSRLVPTAELLHVVDEPLLKVIQNRGMIVESDIGHLRGHLAIAAELGARAVLVTCSTVSPAVDRARIGLAVPVYAIDEAMIQAAVQQGSIIGVIATAASTLDPTRQKLEAQARIENKPITVKSVLVKDALGLLMQGEADRHDILVKRAIEEIADDVEVVVLAQATIARVLDTIPAIKWKVPILASPHLALRQVGRLFDGA